MGEKLRSRSYVFREKYKGFSAIEGKQTTTMTTPIPTAAAKGPSRQNPAATLNGPSCMV